MVFRGSQVSLSLGLCVSGSLLHLWVCVSFDLGLESCSGVSGGKTISSCEGRNLERGGMDGWDGMWRDLEGPGCCEQTIVLRAIV